MATQPDGKIGGVHTFLTAASATGVGTPIYLGKKYVNPVIYIRWSAGVTAGKVGVITSSDKTYAGTWSNLNLDVNFSDSPGTANREDCIQLVGIFAAINVEILTTIANGTVTVTMELD